MSFVSRSFGVLIALANGAALAQTPEELGCALETGPKRTIARVLDAGTVELDDRSVVSLLGLLIPRGEDAGRNSAVLQHAAASQAELTTMALGRTVTLAFAGPRGDRHGRVVAHLFTSDGDKTVWVQGRLVESGLARVFAPPGGEACVDKLLAREAAARDAGRGIWSTALYAVRPADRPTELARYHGTFQLVRSRVAHIQGARSLTVLHLESAEAPRPATSAKAQERVHHGTRVVIRHGSGAARALGSLRALNGREILVRGWIEGRSTPEIELVAEGQLHVDGQQVVRRQRVQPNAERPADGPPGAPK